MKKNGLSKHVILLSCFKSPSVSDFETNEVKDCLCFYFTCLKIRKYFAATEFQYFLIEFFAYIFDILPLSNKLFIECLYTVSEFLYRHKQWCKVHFTVQKHDLYWKNIQLTSRWVARFVVRLKNMTLFPEKVAEAKGLYEQNLKNWFCILRRNGNKGMGRKRKRHVF